MQRRNIRPDWDPETVRQVEALANQCLRQLNHAEDQARMQDKEVAHRIADEALCDLLTGLGLEDVVAKFNEIPKWYA